MPPDPGRGPDLDLDADTLDRLVELYATDVADLARLVPELDLSLWPSFGHLRSGSGTE